MLACFSFNEITCRQASKQQATTLADTISNSSTLHLSLLLSFHLNRLPNQFQPKHLNLFFLNCYFPTSLFRISSNRCRRAEAFSTLHLFLNGFGLSHSLQFLHQRFLSKHHKQASNLFYKKKLSNFEKRIATST